LEDDAFQSVTENLKWTEFFINQPDKTGEYKVSNPALLVIRAERGQKCAPLSAIKSPKQGEYLLPRKTRIQVVKTRNQGKLKILEARIIRG